jgi:hypothetical protein
VDIRGTQKSSLRAETDMIDNDKENMVDWLARTLKAVEGGEINVDIDGRPAIKIDVDKEKLNVDFLQPTLFKTPEEETGLFDKLKIAKEFAQKLTDNGLTLSFLRKGKEAIILGKEAHPTLSRLVTRSDDIQVDSVKESVKLGREVKEKED